MNKDETIDTLCDIDAVLAKGYWRTADEDAKTALECAHNMVQRLIKEIINDK